MMENFEILGRNRDFLFEAYNMHAFLGVFAILGLVDLILKGWAMWRAARMEKNWWFIALLIINSFGILPAIFLLMTRDAYERLSNKSVAPSVPKPSPAPAATNPQPVKTPRKKKSTKK